MRKQNLIDLLRQSEPDLRARGIAHLAVFGSRARGDYRDDSDLDVLVEIDEGRRFSLLDLSGVALTIEDKTGLETQVHLKRSLEPRLAKRIADDLVSVF